MFSDNCPYSEPRTLRALFSAVELMEREVSREKRSERLSDWELGFVDSLQRQLADGRRPSAKQIETLDTIWERATKRG